MVYEIKWNKKEHQKVHKIMMMLFFCSRINANQRGNISFFTFCTSEGTTSTTPICSAGLRVSKAIQASIIRLTVNYSRTARTVQNSGIILTPYCLGLL
jgi:hypothetical protein